MRNFQGIVFIWTQNIGRFSNLYWCTFMPQSGIAHKSVVYKKAFIKFTTWVNFSVYPVFQWSNIVRKVLPKAKGSEKNIKRGDDHIVGRGCLWKGGGGGAGVQTLGTLWNHNSEIIQRILLRHNSMVNG